MVTPAPGHPAVFLLSKREHGLHFIDVEGELEAIGVAGWSALLNGAIEEGATGIAVDLRGCLGIDAVCLKVLVMASTRLTALGRRGVRLVTFPGSALDRRLGTIEELPAHDSAVEALASLGVLP